jgi:hypothetical protein
MYDPRRGEGCIAGGQLFRPLADANRGVPFENEVKFLLALVSVQGVLLTRLE